MSRKGRRLRPSLLVAVLLLLVAPVGCKKKPEPVPEPAPPAASEPAPLPAPEPAALAVSAVTLGKSIGPDQQVTQPAESFAKNDTIYASVATTGAAAQADLAARWTYEGAGGSTLVKEDHQAIAPTGDATTEFHISKPGGWPAGSYKVEISLDGKPVQTKTFTVS